MIEPVTFWQTDAKRQFNPDTRPAERLHSAHDSTTAKNVFYRLLLHPVQGGTLPAVEGPKSSPVYAIPTDGILHIYRDPPAQP